MLKEFFEEHDHLWFRLQRIGRSGEISVSGSKLFRILSLLQGRKNRSILLGLQKDE